MGELEKLHKSLLDNNYDVPKDYSSFEYTLTLPGDEGYQNRVQLWKSLQKNNFDVPDNYEDFRDTLFGVQEAKPAKKTAEKPDTVAAGSQPAKPTGTVRAENGMTFTEGGLDSLEQGYKPEYVQTDAVPQRTQPIDLSRPEEYQIEKPFVEGAQDAQQLAQSPELNKYWANRQQEAVRRTMQPEDTPYNFEMRQQAWKEAAEAEAARKMNRGEFDAANKQRFNELYDRVVAPVFAEERAAGEQRAKDEVRERIRREIAGEEMPQNVAGAMSGIGRAFQTSVAVERETDPERIAANTLKRVQGDEAFGDYVLARMGIVGGTDEHSDGNDSPQLTEREKKFMQMLFARENGEVADQMIQRIYDQYKAEGAPKNALEYIAGKAFHENFVASLYNALVRRAANSSGIRDQLRAMAREEYGQNANLATQIAGGAAPFAVDIMTGGFYVPGIAGGLASQLAMKGGSKLLSRAVTKKLSERAAARGLEDAALKEAAAGGADIAERYLASNSPIMNVVVRSIGSAANFSTFETQSELIKQLGEGKFDAGQLFNQAVHGAALGGVMGVAGGAIANATKRSGLAGRIAGDIAGFGTEAGIFAAANGIEKAIEDGVDITDVNWGDITGQALLMVAGMKVGGHAVHGVGSVIKKGVKQSVTDLANRYRKSKDYGMQLNQRDIDELKQAGYDFSDIFKGLGELGKMAPESATVRRTATEYGVDSEGNGRKRDTESKEAYVDEDVFNAMLSNPEIMSSTKRKLIYMATGKVTNLEPLFGADLIVHDNGKASIVTKNAVGNPIEVKEFDSKEKAQQAYDIVQNVARLNTINGLKKIAKESGFDDVDDLAKGRTKEQTGYDPDAAALGLTPGKKDRKEGDIVPEGHMDAEDVLDAYIKNLQDVYAERLNENMRRLSEMPPAEPDTDATGTVAVGAAGGTGGGVQRSERRQAAYEKGASAVADESQVPGMTYDSQMATARLMAQMPDDDARAAFIRKMIMHAAENGNFDAAEQVLAKYRQELSDKQAEAIEDYLDAYTSQAGMQDAISQEQVEYEEQMRADVANKSDEQGNVTELLMKDGSTAYLKTGDLNAYHGQLIVTTEDGEQKQVSTADVAEVVGSQIAEDVVVAMTSQHTEQMRQMYEGLANGTVLREGQEVDLAIGGTMMHGTMLGYDATGNPVIQFEDGSRMPMRPDQVSAAIQEANNLKIQQVLAEEQEADAVRQRTERFNAGIVGYAEGTPNVSAKDTKPEVAAEYLLSQTDVDGQTIERSKVLDGIQTQIEQLVNGQQQMLQALQQARNNMAMAEEGEEQYQQAAAVIQQLEPQLEDMKAQQRKWGEIRQAMMNNEERQKFESGRIKAVGQAQSKSLKEAQGQNLAAEPQGTIPSGKELVEQYPERTDGEAFVDGKRKEIAQQYREDVYPKYDDIQKTLDDYQKGLIELSADEIKELTDAQAVLSLQMNQLVEQQNQWKKLASDINKLYGAQERKNMTPHELALSRLQTETDKGKKIKLAQEAFKDEPEALAMLENLEPQDVNEWVAAHLGAGSINWEGLQRGEHKVRGLISYFGDDKRRGLDKNSDTYAFNYFLAPTGEGKGVDEVVHAIAEGSPYTTEEVADALYNMLAQATKPTDISHYIENSRIAEAERIYEQNLDRQREQELEAQLEAENDAIREMTGMEPEEYDAYMADLEQRLAEQAGYRNSEEYYNNVAEYERRAKEGSIGGSQETGTLGLQEQEGRPADAEANAERGAGETNAEPEPVGAKLKNSALDNTTDTGETSTGGRQNDTATLQSTVSEGKGTENISEKQEKSEKSAIQGLENYSEEEIKKYVREFVQQEVESADADAEIVDIAIIGSRTNGTAKPDSDLDVLVEFKGKEREDDMFNMLAEADEPLVINGINVDINPIRADKTGTIAEFLERNADYDKSTETKLALEKERDELIRKRNKLYSQGLRLGFFDKGKILAEVEEVNKRLNEVLKELGESEEPAADAEGTVANETKGEDLMHIPFADRLQSAKGETNVNPTEEQKKAGNYKMGHIRFGGYRMSIENPKGSTRSGVDKSGKPWSIEMKDTYGYIGQKYGADGDHLDFFINDDADLDTWNGRVFVIDQKNDDGTFDEHKVMYGYPTWGQARRAYERNYEPGWWDKHVMQMTGVKKDKFDKWLADSDHKTKPFHEYYRTKMLTDVVNDNVDQVLADVRERKNKPAGESAGTVASFKPGELTKKSIDELKQIRKKAKQDLSTARVLLGTIDSIKGTEKEKTLQAKIAQAEADIAAIDAEIKQKETIARQRAEQQEIGFAMTDQLEGMGFGVTTDTKEMRKARKQAEQDKSEEGKLRHFETPDGKLYGFVYKGKMYLDPTKIDAELPIHEYAHPWCEAFRRLNPEGWKNIVGLMKGDKDTWDFVKQLNPDLKDEDDIAEEMIAKFSGKKGQERAEAEYQRMNGKDPDYKSKWNNIWKNISKAIQDFWKQVGDFLHIKYESAEQVYDQVVRDFANKMNPRKRVEDWLKERDDAYMQAVEAGDDTKAKEIFDEALRENIGNGITPFVAVDGYRGKMQKLAHAIKERDPKVIAEVADMMTPLIPKDAVLVPAPSHTGKATDMLDLAQAISERTGAPVADVLTSKERGSQYEAKKAGKPLSTLELGITMQGELPEGKMPVVIDNVVDSGNTAEACVKALGKGIVASLADSAERYKHVASLKSAEPVVKDKNGNVVPLSKRFEITGKYLEKADNLAAKPQDTEQDEMATMVGEDGAEPMVAQDADAIIHEMQRRKEVAEDKKVADDILKKYLSAKPKDTEQAVRQRATKAVLKAMDNAGVPYKVVSKAEEKEMLKVFSMMNQAPIKEFARRSDIRATTAHGRGPYIIYNMSDPFGVPMYFEKQSTAKYALKGLKQMAPEGDWEIMYIGWADEDAAQEQPLKEAANLNPDLQAEIEAWHGSNAVFTKFDHSHMGEGAGSQSFGWGTYLSNSKDIGGSYADLTSKGWSYDGKTLGEYKPVINGSPNRTSTIRDILSSLNLGHPFDEAVNQERRHIESAIRDYEEEIDDLSEADKKDLEIYKEELAFINSLKESDFSTPTKMLYKVDLPEDTGENYLDWMKTIKKPLRRKIADAVRQLDGEPRQSLMYANYNNGWQSLADMIEREQWAYKEIHERLLQAFGGKLADEEKVSKLMSGAGFVGVKYPAGTIYGGGNGATNYVVFNEDDAKIVESIQFMWGDEPDGNTSGTVDTQTPIFVSNAMKAVEGIKQEKATPEQWLAMIQKNGGLKAGEDKWLGLSDWLKEQKGSVTKQDVMDFIRQNQIQVEETPYQEYVDVDNNPKMQEFRDEFNKIKLEIEGNRSNLEVELDKFEDEMSKKYGYGWYNKLNKEEKAYADKFEQLNSTEGTPDEKAFREMVDRYGEDFGQAFEVNYGNGKLEPQMDMHGDDISDAAKHFLQFDEQPINSTRLSYTTEGLDNKREIALTVPTVEPYNEGDAIHFGDAGGGRAVAWIRFGDAYYNKNGEPTEVDKQWNDFMGQMAEKYGKDRDDTLGLLTSMTDEERETMNKLDKQITEKEKRNMGRVLVIGEIQSKRHQDARDQGGYYDEAETKRLYHEMDELQKKRYEITEREKAIFEEIASSDEVKPLLDEDGSLKPEARAKYDEIVESNAELKELKEQWIAVNQAVGEAQNKWKESYDKIPPAPFEKNWHELAMKRMLRYAAENGYDKIAWTTGAQQAERYNIGTIVRSVDAGIDQDGNRVMLIHTKGGKTMDITYDDEGNILTMNDFASENFGDAKNIRDIVGKEIAVGALSVQGKGTENMKTWEGTGLHIGGEGMKGFYDEILPRFMNKYGKKWGVKVGEVELPGLDGRTAENPLTMWSVDVTPEMKESVMQGQVMFQKEGKKLLGWSDGKQVYLTKDGLNPNTPLHETTHIWDNWCMKEQPELWKKLVAAMKKTAMWEEISKNPNYRGIWGDDDKMASEVHARLSGAAGEDEFMKAAFKKDTPKSIINEVKSALRKFWEAVLRLFGKKTKTIGDDWSSLDAIVRMPIRDLVGEDFEKMMKAAGKNRQEAMFAGEKGADDAAGTVADTHTLMGVHNISEDKLKKIIKAGGLANPSLAVIDTKKGMHNGFGEISLIPKSALIDSKTGRNAGTYLGDAYTPTYPTVETSLSEKGRAHITEIAKAAAGDDEQLMHHLRGNLKDYIEGNGSRLHYLFLLQTGRNPKPAMKRLNYSENAYNELKDMIDGDILDKRELTQEENDRIMNAMLNERLAKYGDKLTPEKREAIEKNFRDNNVGKDGKLFFSKWYTFVEALSHDARQRKNPTIDWYGTDLEAQNRVNDERLYNEYEEWKKNLLNDEDINEELFAGYDRNGYRKTVPNTVENASRLMNKEADVNSYDSSGIGATRSTLLKKVNTLAEIRKNKDKIGLDSDAEQAVKDASDKLFEIIQELSEMQKISDNPFMNNDYAEARLQEAFGKKNPLKHLRDEYGYDIADDSDLGQRINEFMNTVKDLPVKYFETKFKRPVGLNEFAVAVVPEATSPEVIKALKDAGLDVRTYDASDEKTANENRQKVAMDAVSGRDDILFRHSTPEVEKLNSEFNDKLQEQIDGKLPTDYTYQLGKPSVPLLSTGIPNVPILMQANVLARKSKDAAHPYSLEEAKDLVKHIQKPLAIFEYGDKEQAQNLMVGIHQAFDQEEGRQFLVGLALEPVVKGKKLEYNSVRNVFPKNFHDWIHWINQGKLLRADGKKEIEAIIDALRINPVDHITIDDLNDAAKILNNFENPKLSEEKLRELFPEQVEAAERTAEMLGGLKVVFESESSEGGTLGWYDPNDHSVHVVLPENADVNETVRTVCHEKLGHEGLVALLGSQEAVNKFGTFIFRSAGKTLRQRILERADEEGYSWSDPLRLSKAAQEVFADIAADGPATEEEFSLWDKVKHYIIRACKAIGLKVRGLLNDHDLRYYVLKTDEALKKWNQMDETARENLATQATRHDIMRSRNGKPRQRRGESMASYMQRLTEWEKWRVARQTAKDNGDPEPTEEQFHEQAEAEYKQALQEWKERNGITEGQTFDHSFPRRRDGESPQEYAVRVADYEANNDLWQTAPNYMEFMRKASDDYRQAYLEWRLRYDLEEEATVDQRLYEGDVEPEPTFTDAEEEARAQAELDLADAMGIEVDEEGAKRHAKLAVIERRKNMESANAEDAIWVYDFVKMTDELAAQLQGTEQGKVTGKELRAALPFLIEADRRRENMQSEKEDAIVAINMSDAIQKAHSTLSLENLDQIGAEVIALEVAWQDKQSNPNQLADMAYREAARALADKLNELNSQYVGYEPLFADDIMQIRSLLVHAITAGGGEVIPASAARFDGIPEVKQLMEHVKEWYDEFFALLEDAGLRGDAGYIEEGYVNHVWDKEKSDPKAWEKFVENRQRTKSPNMRHREIDTYMDGIKVGLVPKYNDIADMIAHYSRQNNEAIANSRFLDDFKGIYVRELNDEGEVTAVLPMVMLEKPESFIRERYAQYNVPGVGDVYVLKHVQKRFANVFGTMRTPDAADWLSKLGAGYDITSSTAKKIQLALSGFHALALFEVDVAQNNPMTAMKHLLKYIIADSIKTGTLPAYAHPEDFKLAAEHLVQLGATEDYAAADVNAITQKLRDTFKGMYESDEAWKKAVGVAGSPAAIMMDWINKGFDTVLWNYLHDGLKLSAFKELAKQVDRRVEKQGLDEKMRNQLLDEAGQYVNDMFGGQYWELLNVSPATLKWMRRLFLSPDWLVSTQRHFFANFGFGSVYSDGGFREYVKYNMDNIKRLFGADVPQNELRRLRSKNAKYCYMVGAIIWWGLFYNAINALCRWKDEQDEKDKAEEIRKTDPNYKSPYELAYPDGMKWYDYTMYGNAIGQQTHLFTGRYADGTETYVRWGKQFREFPELFMGRHGAEFPAPLIQRMMSKANPNIGTVIDFLGAQNIGGFNGSYENKELREKYGKTVATLAATARHFIPFGMPTQAEKEYKLMDFFMPSSKGFSRYKARDYFETFILDGNWEGIEATYNACVMNGIDAEAGLNAAISSIKATQRKELSDGVTDLTTATQKFDAATEPKERALYLNKIKKYLKDGDYKQLTREEAMDKIRSFMDGTDVSEKENVRYTMLATSADIIAEEKLKDLGRKAKQIKKELEAKKSSPEYDAMKQRYGTWLKVDKIVGKATRAISKSKKLLGAMNEDSIMNSIRETVKEAQGKIDELQAVE